MKHLIFIFLALAMLNLEAIDGIHGGVFFCDGQAHPYTVCLTNKAGDEVCHMKSVISSPTLLSRWSFMRIGRQSRSLQQAIKLRMTLW